MKTTTHKLLPIENYYSIVETTTNAIWSSLIKKTTTLNNTETKQDLYQEGMVALVECYNRYKEEKKVVFITYALHRIRGKMIDYLRAKDTMSRTSRAKFKRIEEDYKNNVISLEERNKKLHDISNVLTIELQTIQNTDKESGEVFTSAGFELRDVDNVFDQIEAEHLVTKILNKNKSLTEKERFVIENYYFKEKNFKTIAKELSVQESRVSQLHSTALHKLRAETKDR